MLRADWAFFLELTSYALHGLSPGSVAFGIEEVSEAVAQMVVAVIFVPVGCGHGGEGAVRKVAAAGGRGYIVGLPHELHDDVAAWGAAAILRQPLQHRLATVPLTRRAEAEGDVLEPEQKRQRTEGPGHELMSAAVPKSAMLARRTEDAAWLQPGAALSVATPKAAMLAPPPPPGGPALQWWEQGPAAAGTANTPALPRPFLQETQHDDQPFGIPAEETAAAPAPASPPKPLRPEDHERDVRQDIKTLGKIECLYDKDTIPKFGEALRDRYLPALGGVTVFSALGDAFVKTKGVAHRKAMVYSAHELIMRKRGRALAVDDRRVSCLRHFFMRIGKSIRGFRTDERRSYVRLVEAWQAARSFQPTEMLELKEAWDVD